MVTFGHFTTSGHILLNLSFISHYVNDIIGLKDPEREGRLLKQLLHEMPIFGCESSPNKVVMYVSKLVSKCKIRLKKAK